jgi:hypothetical protein
MTTAPPVTGDCEAVADWAVPDRGLTAAHMAAADAVLATVFAAGAHIDLAFLGGSLAVGLGHDLSDIDLHIVGTGDRLAGSRVHHHGGFQVQVNPISPDRATRLIDLGRRFTASATERDQIDVDEDTLSELIRLLDGRVLFTAPSFAPVLAQADRDVVRKIMMVRRARAVTALAEDARGALGCGDWRTAYTAATLGLGHAADCLLAGAGDLYVGPKFLHRRLARCAATRDIAGLVWAHYWQPLSAADGPTLLNRSVEDLLWLAGYLTSHSLLDGWEQPLDVVPPPRRSLGGPVRSPYFSLLRFGDGIGLSGPDCGFKVSEGTARLWLALDGRAVPEVVAGLRDDHPALCALDDSTLTGAIDDLVRRGTATAQSKGGEFNDA